jgi:hypothetical protein
MTAQPSASASVIMLAKLNSRIIKRHNIRACNVFSHHRDMSIHSYVIDWVRRAFNAELCFIDCAKCAF